MSGCIAHTLSNAADTPLVQHDPSSPASLTHSRVCGHPHSVRSGAKAFLWAEYQICFIFIAGFGIVIFILVSHVEDPVTGRCVRAHPPRARTRARTAVRVRMLDECT